MWKAPYYSEGIQSSMALTNYHLWWEGENGAFKRWALMFEVQWEFITISFRKKQALEIKSDWRFTLNCRTLYCINWFFAWLWACSNAHQILYNLMVPGRINTTLSKYLPLVMLKRNKITPYIDIRRLEGEHCFIVSTERTDPSSPIELKNI